MSEQPPNDPLSSDPPSGDPVSGPDPHPTIPTPPPYGQAGATWPNSQPAAPSPYGGGQPPPGPPGPPGYGAPPGYGGQVGYGGPYIPPLPKQSSAGKIVAIVVGVVLLLTCGGCFAFGAVIYSSSRDIIREIESYEPPVDQDEVVTVTPGEAFLVGEFSIDSGWSIDSQGPVPVMDGMVARVVGAPQLATVAFDMTFFLGERELGQATCSGVVPADGSEAEISCYVSDRRARRADRVEVRSLV